MKNILFVLLFALFIFAGCDGNNGPLNFEGGNMAERALFVADDSQSLPSPPEDKISEDETDSGIPEPALSDKKKIIRDGNISMKVNDTEIAKKEIDSLVKIYKAYYSSENLMTGDYSLTYDLRIRIPSENFERFIASLEEGEGEIIHKLINARDVTAEFIDLESRLSNKRTYLERYRALLSQAKNVKEILEIEEQIRILVEEIESSEGRLKYLSDQVAFSTLDLMLVKETGYKYRPATKGPFGERLKRSLSGGWNGLVAFALILVRLWPLWIILAVAIPLWIKHRRRRSR